MELSLSSTSCRVLPRSRLDMSSEGTAPDWCLSTSHRGQLLPKMGLRRLAHYFAANPTLLQRFGRPHKGGLGATVFGHQSRTGTWSTTRLQSCSAEADESGLAYQVSYTFSKCMSDSRVYGAWNNALSAIGVWQMSTTKEQSGPRATTMPLTSYRLMRL